MYYLFLSSLIHSEPKDTSILLFQHGRKQTQLLRLCLGSLCTEQGIPIIRGPQNSDPPEALSS